MLNNFFRINLPYGIMKNEKNQWIAFNREYQPLGINQSDFNSLNEDLIKQLPLYTEYKRLTENKLISLAYGENGIQRDDKGEIYRIYFYNDELNPTGKNASKELWNKYFSIIEEVSKLEKQ
ncbi:hypothetical protein SAMN04488018_11348 [Myroides marinus]|uniref:Uncharacterized protein n=3 Tax=Flavobacteriaceae TaxID=49546 RepID=A0A1H6W8T6_9FLAO|nr:hypothetical protein HMPREF9712_00135 [Myroides odoratimimus CCUG 10230]SEJ13398.1 hypothetical protein SAMN04488018_11348 [Myroides marinus]